jgi:alkylhydroperoxidase family enzyme
MSRIEPLAPRAFPKEMRQAMAALRPANATHAAPVSEDRPKALSVLGTLAHHPALAQAFFTFNGHILGASTLSERQRELLIMRVAANRKCGYEWAQHLFMARDAGLTDEEIGRIAYGPDAPFWDDAEAAMLRSVDELIDDGAISETTWHILSGAFNERQLLDVIFTVGLYDILARLFASLDLTIDDDIHQLMKRYDQLF